MNSQYSDFWVGITDIAWEGRFKFENGVDATNLMFSWSSGEPNNQGNEDCVYLDKIRNRINDLNCDSYHPSYVISSVMCQIPNDKC